MNLFSRKKVLNNSDYSTIQNEENPQPSNTLNDASIAAFIDSVAAGCYDAPLEFEGDLISEALQRHVDQLSQSASSDLARTVKFSGQLSEAMVAVSRMADDVRDVGDNSQTMSAAVEEMAASTSQVSNTSAETTAAAQIAQDAAQQGLTQVACAAEAMQNISEVTQKLATRLDVLEEASVQIEGMANTIEEISDQTKLLALNATIEAARAGEYGKGFAVVASEVKSLSEQTKRATDHIAERIQSLNMEMKEMRLAVSASAKAVDEGDRVVNEVGSQIDSIVQQVTGVNTRMGEISNVLDEQRQATGDIAVQVSKIASRAMKARDNVDSMISAVGGSETLINNQFKTLENKTIHDYVLHRAKSDHLIWKKKLAELLSGLSNLDATELADHRSCRLGKWYDQVTDPTLRSDPRFRNLLDPHEKVHSHGKQSAKFHAAGQIEQAHQEFAAMEKASDEVLHLLDELIAR
jgi:methyl-accepting chemotaxis protein